HRLDLPRRLRPRRPAHAAGCRSPRRTDGAVDGGLLFGADPREPVAGAVRRRGAVVPDGRPGARVELPGGDRRLFAHPLAAAGAVGDAGVAGVFAGAAGAVAARPGVQPGRPGAGPLTTDDNQRTTDDTLWHTQSLTNPRLTWGCR